MLRVDAEDLLDQATSEATKAVALAPDDGSALALATNCALLAAQLAKSPQAAQAACDKARGYVTHGLKVHPDSVMMYKNLAEIEMRAKSRDQAIAVLRRGVDATDRHPELLKDLAELMIDAGDFSGRRRSSMNCARRPQPARHSTSSPTTSLRR